MNTEIKNLLGIKQEDLAMILGVSRGQLSMYIIGKRNLPIEAKLILSELVAVFSNNKKQMINNNVLNNDLDDAEKIFYSMKKIDAYKKIVLQKKLSILERKYADSKKTIALIEYLETSLDFANNDKKQLYDLIKSKAEIEIKKYGLTAQISLKIELESLKNKEKTIQKQFSKFFSDAQKLT